MTQYVKITTSNILAYSNDLVIALSEQVYSSKQALDTNISNSKSRETILFSNISNETSRATTLERSISSNIINETTRATTLERSISTNIINETTRALNQSDTLTSSISTETKRANNEENRLSNILYNIIGTSPSNMDQLVEIGNAIVNDPSIATTLSNTISNETSRATSIESVIAINLSNETRRATSVETVISSNILTEITRANSVENIISSNTSLEIRRAISEETKLTNILSIENNSITTRLNSRLNTEISRAKSVETIIENDNNTLNNRVKITNPITFTVAPTISYTANLITSNSGSKNINNFILLATGIGDYCEAYWRVPEKMDNWAINSSSFESFAKFSLPQGIYIIILTVLIDITTGGNNDVLNKGIFITQSSDENTVDRNIANSVRGLTYYNGENLNTVSSGGANYQHIVTVNMSGIIRQLNNSNVYYNIMGISDIAQGGVNPISNYIIKRIA